MLHYHPGRDLYGAGAWRMDERGHRWPPRQRAFSCEESRLGGEDGRREKTAQGTGRQHVQNAQRQSEGIGERGALGQERQGSRARLGKRRGVAALEGHAPWSLVHNTCFGSTVGLYSYLYHWRAERH